MTGSTSVLDAVIAADLELLAPVATMLGRRIEAASAAVGTAAVRDWPTLLVERAALQGLPAPTRVSSGGACQLHPCLDGWIAVCQARPSDREAVPAWLAMAGADGARFLDGISRCRADRLVESAELLGLPVGVPGERTADPDGGVVRTSFGPADRRATLRVVDLSAIWAGPLCGSILAAVGSDAVKVESVGRPDRFRQGCPELFERLNGAKRIVSLDPATRAGRAELADLVRGADVVVESARPRGLEQLGIVAADELAAPDGPRVWVSVTGHGRASNRVGFGDDAAVAGGLVADTGDGPRFMGDAIADPITGLAAAATALEALATGERTLVDASLAGAAAWAAVECGLKAGFNASGDTR